MATTLITDIAELDLAIKTAVKSAIIEVNEEIREKNRIERIYTINQVSKIWKKSHKTVKRMVTDGLLKTTADGLITESSINEYLHKS